ncbi:substrate-binding periplasmic protein [Vibrio sp. SCSIO 43137]|uniref:substrate-binding periplasmic protein n=1 Tax=Vibrio sp. SCSIO 43137 TaxID=3021011 RepID=UPI0023082435|nr:ABC transporter substrate-binding protein [Vibrio sp. SCSIO 43137]WCE31497.1 ABC transporter substrate-binding protein [Vibrio sp. SCSIO 43137]
MNVRLRKLILFALLIGYSATGFALGSLTYFTEEYPPYKFTENGKITGIAVDLLRKASKEVDAEVSMKAIKLYPWARDYRIVLNTPDTVLFSTGRTRQREKLFKWAGPIGDTRIVVLAKKSNNIVINTPEDLAEYSIGVVLDDIGEQLVLEAGASQNRIEYANTAVPLARMLFHDRIQLWSYEEKVALWSTEKAGIDPNAFEVVYVLQTVSLYYAFNHDIDDSLVQRLQKGIDLLKIKKEGETSSEYDKIVSRYIHWQ